MRMLQTLPNENGSHLEAHTLDVPVCCPVSKNPRPGSTITISYRPESHKLEVGALYAYLHQYRGGLRDETGEIILRDMEGMIARVAADCATAVGVAVGVCAHLAIAPKQTMFLLVRKQYIPPASTLATDMTEGNNEG